MKCIGFVWNLHMVDHVDFGPKNVMESGQLIVQTIYFLLSIDQVLRWVVFDVVSCYSCHDQNISRAQISKYLASLLKCFARIQ